MASRFFSNSVRAACKSEPPVAGGAEAAARSAAGGCRASVRVNRRKSARHSAVDRRMIPPEDVGAILPPGVARPGRIIYSLAQRPVVHGDRGPDRDEGT